MLLDRIVMKLSYLNHRVYSVNQLWPTLVGVMYVQVPCTYVIFRAKFYITALLVFLYYTRCPSPNRTAQQHNRPSSIFTSGRYFNGSLH